MPRMPRYRVREEAYPERPAIGFAERRRRAEQLAQLRRYETAETAAARRAARMIARMEEQRERVRYYERPEAVPPAYRESIEFYTRLGYPRLAGKYQAFDVPAGYKVEKIVEKKGELKVTFEPTVKPPPAEPVGVAETMLGVDLPTLGLAPKAPFFVPWYAKPRPPEAGLAGLAGMVAAVEAPIYTVGRIIGVPTPKPPPYPFETKYPEYGVGYIIGSALLAHYAGKAIAKTPVGKAVAKAEAYAVRKITKPLVGTRIDKFLYGKSATWKKLHPIRGEHFISPPYMQTAKGVPIVTKELLEIEQKIVFPALVTPKTGVMYFPKVALAAPPVPVELPTLTAIGVMGAEPFIRITPPKLVEPIAWKPPKPEEYVTPLAFEKYKWRMPSAGELFFEKAKMPTLGALLKEERAQVLLPRLITAPKEVVPAIKAITPIFREPAVVTGVSPYIFGAAIIGIPTPRLAVRERPEIKEVERLKVAPIVRPTIFDLSKEIMEVAPEIAERVEEVPAVAPAIGLEPLTAQIEEAVTITPTVAPPLIYAPPELPFFPPKRPPVEEPKVRRRRRRRRILKPWQVAFRAFEYPIRKEEDVPSFIFGGLVKPTRRRKTTRRKVKGMNLFNTIFGD